jgi:hypothetical protein
MFDMYIDIEPFYLSILMFKLQTLIVEFQLSSYPTSRDGILEEVLPNDNSWSISRLSFHKLVNALKAIYLLWVGVQLQK